MNSVLQNVKDLEELLKDLKRIESKMLDGKFFYAMRDVTRVYSNIERQRNRLIENSIEEGEEKH